MLHDIRRRRTCLSERERGTLLAIAEAALPAGRILPAAGPDCVAKVEDFLAIAGGPVAAAYRALLHAIDASALARRLRPLSRLSPAARLEVLEAWRRGDYLRRTSLRAVLTPLKIAHYHDPAFYRQLGCVFGVTTPARDETPRWMAERVVAAADLPGDEELECDVVVVGTGAGGAVVARELAERGHAVVLLEEGDYVRRSELTGHSVEMQRKLYRDMGATIAVGNVGIPIPIGKSVGGTTTINSGTCYRVPDRVLAKWRRELGLSEFTPDHLAPYYERVEAVLGVAPADPRYLGGAARAVARGCEALGYRHGPLRRNAPDCDGQGLCCLGCPTDAKRSTNVSYVPLALRAGARLFTGARVTRILVEGGRAAGVEAEARRGPRTIRLRVRARVTVLACGALLTPVLLEQNGLANSSGQLGRNLSIHPAVGLYAWFDEKIEGYKGIPQGYAIEEFHDEGILFEGATAPLDTGAALMPLIGPRFVELVEAFDHAAMFGFMIEDTSRGRVRATRSGRPFMTYVLCDHDVAKLKRGTEILARVFFAAGARVVFPLVHGFDELRGEADLARFRRARLRARDFDITAYHPLGTARMGLDRRSSVVGPDHETHDVRDLYITDGSAVPSSLAVNPQLTIMALATRAADRIDRRLG